jgi:hypothetical protein
VLASTLTGHSPGGFSCLDRNGTAGDTAGLTRALRKTFGRIESDRTRTSLVIEAESARRAWAYAHFAVANAQQYGVTNGDRGRSSVAEPGHDDCRSGPKSLRPPTTRNG